MEITGSRYLSLYCAVGIPDEFRSLLFREDVVACEVPDCQMFMRWHGYGLRSYRLSPAPTGDNVFRLQNGLALALHLLLNYQTFISLILLT